MVYTRINGFLIEGAEHKIVGDVIKIDGVDFEIISIDTYDDDGVDRVYYNLKKNDLAEVERLLEL